MKSTFFINWGFCTGATRRPSHMRELIDVWRKIRMLRELPKRQRLAEMQIMSKKVMLALILGAAAIAMYASVFMTVHTP